MIFLLAFVFSETKMMNCFCMGGAKSNTQNATATIASPASNPPRIPSPPSPPLPLPLPLPHVAFSQRFWVCLLLHMVLHAIDIVMQHILC